MEIKCWIGWISCNLASKDTTTQSKENRWGCLEMLRLHPLLDSIYLARTAADSPLEHSPDDDLIAGGCGKTATVAPVWS